MGSIEGDRLWTAAERSTIAIARSNLAVLPANRPPGTFYRQTILSGAYAATLALCRADLLMLLLTRQERPAEAPTARVTLYTNSLCLLTVAEPDDHIETAGQSRQLDESLRRFAAATGDELGAVTVDVNLVSRQNSSARWRTSE